MKNSRAVAHVIYGPTAAGKSTFGRALCAEGRGVRFTVDEWMHALFGPDVPEQLSLSWALSRALRCQDQIWSVARQVLAAGTDSVLELGLLRRTDRDRIKAKIEQEGHVAQFHFIDAELEIRRQRVLRRNAERGETYSFDVTPVMFDTIEAYFERPTESELDGQRARQGAAE